MQSRSIPAPTKDEKKRFEAMRDIGCIACIKAGRTPPPAEVHHLLDGGVRIGHSATVGLCEWCHRGVRPFWIKTDEEAKLILGPSVAHGSRVFSPVYGNDGELLEFQNRLLKERGYAGV